MASVSNDRWSRVKRFALFLEVGCLIAGLVLHLSSSGGDANLVWSAGTIVALVLMTTEMLRNAFRGNFALDFIAAVAMLAAVILGEALAGVVVATMYLGGQWLEDLAHGRVQREMNALLERAPRIARRFANDRLEHVDVVDILPGDRLLVSRGEIVPVDGMLLSPTAILDQSSLTGEALPAKMVKGDGLLSGVTNAADAFEMQATRTSAESTYSGIVKLVEGAQSSKSPAMRLADRYSVAFLLLTALASGLAWLISGSPIRALAVLVVATPCPLILAVPIAILSGVSRAARRGILIKGGEALEHLADADTLLMDKTGTITDGRAHLLDIRTFDDFDPSELLRYAASLDQGSQHVTAVAIVEAARERMLSLHLPEDLKEEAGSGIEGRVEGRKIGLGSVEFIQARSTGLERLAQLQSVARSRSANLVCVAVDGVLAGGLLMGDNIRIETPTVLRRLREAGIRRFVLLTGDHPDNAKDVAATLGIDDFKSEMKPQDKIAAVKDERTRGRVIMVGDGVNDAPALAAADVGVAMGARGAAASAEAANVVLLVDRLDRLVAARAIAHRSVQIAKQSAVAGILLSVLAMGAAIAGYLSPIEGAILQEAIDVSVILNALRALGQPGWLGGRHRLLTAAQLSELETEHRQMSDVIAHITALADDIPHLASDELRLRLTALEVQLRQQLLKHEMHDEGELFPRLRGEPGSAEMLTGLSRAHMEIRRRLLMFATLAGSLPANPGAIERRDIQRLLDGLAAIAVLHFEEEEEIYRLVESG